MKRFQYNLETVLRYKNQMLDNLKTEHAAAMEKVSRKQEEIQGLERRLTCYQDRFDAAKCQGGSIETLKLYDICIGGARKQIDEEQERLRLLQDKEKEKKEQVMTAKVDSSRYEKLKERRLDEYEKAVQKEEEAFVESFIVRGITWGD